MVTPHSGLKVDGSRYGYIEPNSRTTTAATTTTVATNAQPSLDRDHINATEISSATTATARGADVHGLPWASWVHSPKPPASRITGRVSMRANRKASSRMGPAVFKAMNTEP